MKLDKNFVISKIISFIMSDKSLDNCISVVGLLQLLSYQNELTTNNVLLNIENKMLLNKEIPNSSDDSFVAYKTDLFLFYNDLEFLNFSLSDRLTVNDLTVRIYNIKKKQAISLFIEWEVKKATYGLIKFNTKSLYVDQGSVLLNTIYFNALWKESFQSLHTSLFYNGKENIIQKMMNIESEFLAFENSDLLSIQIPYKNPSFSFVAIMPKENDKWDKVKDYISDTNQFEDILSQMTVQNIDLRLPKFQIRSNFDVLCFLQSYKKLLSEEMTKLINEDMMVQQEIVFECETEGEKLLNVDCKEEYAKQNYKVYNFNKPFLWFVMKKASSELLSPILCGKFSGNN